MFGIGSGELFFIAIVALIVLGPERLPKAARFVGLWVRRARAHWYSVKDELERELAAEELKRSLDSARASVREAEASLREHGAAAQRGFERMRDEVKDEVRTEAGAVAAAVSGSGDRDGAAAPAAPAPAIEEGSAAPAADAGPEGAAGVDLPPDASAQAELPLEVPRPGAVKDPDARRD